MAGTLVLVVGPSGAGKDTLIGAARAQLAGDPRFVFVRRLVTREAVTTVEDHDTISRADFSAGRDSGAFALCWEAHGLGYALPHAVLAELGAGKVVVANVSRHVIGDAFRRFAACRVLSISADEAIRARRLDGRGREAAEAVTARLSRQVDDLPDDARVTTIDNSGDLRTSSAAFVAALVAAAAK